MLGPPFYDGFTDDAGDAGDATDPWVETSAGSVWLRVRVMGMPRVADAGVVPGVVVGVFVAGELVVLLLRVLTTVDGDDCECCVCLSSRICNRALSLRRAAT